MALLACCIVPGGHLPPPGLPGIAGGAVQYVECGPGLGAWLSATSQLAGPAADVARAHHRVIMAAMDGHVTPVPLRFGQAFEDAAAAAAAIARDAARWRRLLQRFAGRAEYGVRVSRAAAGDDGQVVEAARDVHRLSRESGTAYMAALAERHAEASRARDETERLATFLREAGCIDDTRTEALRGTGLVSMAHLVAWENADAYHAAVRSLRAGNRHLEFVCTGPWPPYSFVE